MMSDHVRSKLCWSDITDQPLKIIMHTAAIVSKSRLARELSYKIKIQT